MNDKSDDTIEKAMQRLRQGLMTGSTELVSDAHRSLYNAVPQSIPYIVANLRSLSLDKAGRGEFINLAVGLAALLHDIDERAAEEFFDAAETQQVHPVIKAGFRSIRRFTKDDYRLCNSFDIDIYEHKCLPVGSKSPSDHVVEWLLQVPGDDLAGLSRIYISWEDELADFRGYYLPGLAVITVLWDATATKSSISRFLIRRTLYHEVGHHVRRHRLGWQDPEQEDEAEQYAMRMLARAYPNLRRFGNLVRWLRGKPPLEL